MRDAIKRILIVMPWLILFLAGGVLNAQCDVAELAFTVDGERIADGGESCSAATFLGVVVRRDGGAVFENEDCGSDLGDLSFRWSTTELRSPCIDLDPDVQVISSTTYMVTVTCVVGDGDLGTNDSIISVTITNIPDFTLEAGNCSGETINLQPAGLPDDPGLSYTWRRNASVLGSVRSINVTIPEAGEIASYSLEVEYQETCSTLKQITLRGDDLRPDLTINQSGTMACSGATVQVTASSTSQSVTGFSWFREDDNESGMFNGTIDLGPGTYVISTIGGGCMATDEITITEMPGPDPPDLTGDIPATLCGDETVMIGINTVAGLRYSWRDVNGVEQSTATSFAAGPGILEVFAINIDDGCTSEPERINIAELNGHTPNITVSPTGPYCEGDLITLSATNLRGGTATWSTNEVGPMIMVESGGDYSVTYEGGDLCPASTNRIIPDFGEPPSLPLQPDASVLSGETASLQVNLGEAVRVRVPVDSIVTQNASVSEVSVINGGLLFFEPTGTAGTRSTGAIRFTLIPESEEGCTGPAQTLLVRVVPDVEEPFIPEIISPNGDGSNDQWAVVFPEDGADYDVVVYSRGGAVVFEGSGNQLPWDAGACPNGVYYYRISQRGPEGGQWQGALTIIGREGR